jgi:hypothetical protein
MNRAIVYKINNFCSHAKLTKFSNTIDNNINSLAYLIEQLNIYPESSALRINCCGLIEKVIFEMMINVSNCRNVTDDFIYLFSDIIVEILDDKIKSNENVDELASMFDNMKVSLSLKEQMAEMEF